MSTTGKSPIRFGSVLSILGAMQLALAAVVVTTLFATLNGMRADGEVVDFSGRQRALSVSAAKHALTGNHDGATAVAEKMDAVLVRVVAG